MKTSLQAIKVNEILKHAKQSNSIHIKKTQQQGYNFNIVSKVLNCLDV